MLPLCIDLQYSHSSHVEPVMAFCLYHAYEDIIARWAADDASHAVAIDCKLTDDVTNATASTGCLNECHFKGKYLLQDASSSIAIQLFSITSS